MRLAQHDAPVARMYGTLTTPDEREILFIEYLTGAAGLHPFDRFVGDADSFLPFLALGARFHAIQPSEEYRAELYHQSAGDVRRWLDNAAQALERIWKCAPEGELGDDLKDLCAASRGKLPRLQELAADLVAPVSQMEAGLAHGDFYPDQALRREQTGEVLLVDLGLDKLMLYRFDAGRGKLKTNPALIHFLTLTS